MSTALIAQTFRAGIGLRQPHYRDFRVAQSDVRFVEVHSENFLTLMMRRRRCWPSCDRITPSFAWRRSGAGFSLWAGRAAFGQACRARLAYRTCAGVGPCLLRRARHGPHGIVHANDLLPVAFTREQLAIFCAHVQQVQDRLRRPILVENLSSYLDYADCDFREPQFLPSWVCTGCGLLLDVNNLMVNAKNANEPDPLRAVCDWLDALARASPPGPVREMYPAGRSVQPCWFTAAHRGRPRNPSNW